MPLPVKKNKIILCDSNFIVFFLKCLFFKNIYYINEDNTKEIIKTNKKNINLDIVLFGNFNEILAKDKIDLFFKDCIKINFIFFNDQNNLIKIREYFHKIGFFEIISHNFKMNNLFSSINLTPHSTFLISGDNPGNPNLSSIFSWLKIYKYADPILREYKWISHGKRIKLDKNGFLCSSGSHIRKFTSEQKNLNRLRVSVNFILKKNINFAIFFNLAGPGKNHYYEMRVVYSKYPYLVINNLQDKPTIVDKMILPLNRTNNKITLDFNKENFDIFLNNKLFISNISVEKFNSFDYGLEVLSDSIMIKEFKEELFS
jgi:hypothetical protein